METRDLVVPNSRSAYWGWAAGSSAETATAIGGFQSQKDVEDMIGAALDSGINYFDTAESYNDGESERSRFWCRNEIVW